MMPTRWIIWYVTVLHLAWAFLFLWDASATQGTGPAALRQLFLGNVPITSLVLLISAGLTLWAITRPVLPSLCLGMLLPQQVLLMVASLGAVQAVMAGSYADGVIRSKYFILADQLPGIMLFFAHSAAVWELFWERRKAQKHGALP